jgi:hypothetical protein
MFSNFCYMSQFITLSEAVAMTALYRSNREIILKTEYQGQALLPLAETFDRAVFDTVLAKSGCAGLRIYFGMAEDLRVHTLIVGVDADGRDIIPSSLPAVAPATEEDIIENGTRCPDICPETSLLNS